MGRTNILMTVSLGMVLALGGCGGGGGSTEEKVQHAVSDFVDGQIEDAKDAASDFAQNQYDDAKESVSDYYEAQIDRITESLDIPTEERVAEARSHLPQDIFESFVEADYCRNEAPFFEAGRIPSLITLIGYLGFEKGDVESGYEDALLAWLEARADDVEKGLVPRHGVSLAALFGEAMSLSGGDVFQALLAAHNVLREHRTDAPIQNALQNIRNDGGDESGARYHLFGMASYAFAYEYFRRHPDLAGDIDLEKIDPENVALLAEAAVSGDILTDTMEYAVDLEGAELGRKLYREMTGKRLEELAETFDLNTTMCESAR